MNPLRFISFTLKEREGDTGRGFPSAGLLQKWPHQSEQDWSQARSQGLLSHVGTGAQWLETFSTAFTGYKQGAGSGSRTTGTGTDTYVECRCQQVGD